MPVLSLESITRTFNALQSEAEGLKNLTTLAAVREAIVDLKEKIFTAREAQLSALNEINELKQKLLEMENWEAQKKRYEVFQSEPGVTVYALKSSMAAGEPTHHACPACFQKKQISILQRTDRESYSRKIHFCPSCKTELAYGPQVRHDMRVRTVDEDYNPFHR